MKKQSHKDEGCNRRDRVGGYFFFTHTHTPRQQNLVGAKTGKNEENVTFNYLGKLMFSYSS